LAGRGLRVLLLDRAAFPRDKPCGEYASPETENILRRLGALDAVEQAGARRLRAFRVISPAGHVCSMDYADSDYAGHPQHGSNPNQAPAVLATSRRALDAVLVDHARRRGAEVRERVKVESIIAHDGRVTGVLARDLRGTQEIQARLVVGADGVHSVVVHSLGIAAPIRWPRNLGLVAHYRGYLGLDDWGEMHVSHRGYAGLAPLSDGVVNVGLVMPMRYAVGTGRMSAVRRFEAFAFSFEGVARALAGAERVSPVRGVGPVGARVRRTSGAGYLLVGDAAGFFDPFTGEGVYRALRGAELAAEVAADALERHDLSARSLARYSKLRRREFLAKDLLCRLVQLFVAVPPAMDYAVLRLGRRQGVRKVLTATLGDLADARTALSPRFLFELLRP
jgi:flavin-dependent dehydrogenase